MGKAKEVKEPQYVPSLLNNGMLNYRVYYMSMLEKVIYFVGVFIIGGLVGYIFYGGLFKQDGAETIATCISNCLVFSIIGGITVKIFIPAIKKSLQEKRQKKLEKQFVDLLESIASSLVSGNTVNAAFINAKTDLLNQYTDDDMIIKEINEINLGLNNGRTLEEMLLDFGKRSNSEDVKNFSNVISNCYRLGGNFSSVVRRTRDIICDKNAINDEITTKLSSNKLQHNAMCIMPIVLVAMLKMSSPSFAENLSSFLGVFMTTIAIGIFVGSYFWGRKIIDIR